MRKKHSSQTNSYSKSKHIDRYWEFIGIVPQKISLSVRHPSRSQGDKLWDPNFQVYVVFRPFQNELSHTPLHSEIWCIGYILWIFGGAIPLTQNIDLGFRMFLEKISISGTALVLVDWILLSPSRRSRFELELIKKAGFMITRLMRVMKQNQNLHQSKDATYWPKLTFIILSLPHFLQGVCTRGTGTK